MGNLAQTREQLLQSRERVDPGGEDWIHVFRQRGVWQLDAGIVERWVASNPAFFGTLARVAPAGSTVLEIGCGPGRHAIGAASLGFQVTGIDLDPQIVRQAQRNAEALGADVAFRTGDMYDLDAVAPRGSFGTITHGGVMEHLASARSIRETLRMQLAYAPRVVFDVPVDSPKNRGLFARDTIFRQLWTPEQWVREVLFGLPIVEAHTDLHAQDNMTDDLVVALQR